MQKIRRIILAILLSAFMCFNIFSVSLHDAYYTLNDPIRTVVSSIFAAYYNVPQIALPGVTIIDGIGVVPKEIHFKQSDISFYKDSLLTPQSSNSLLKFLSMAINSVSPLTENAIIYLDRLAASKGDFIVDGRMILSGADLISLTDVLSMQFTDNLTIKVDCKLNLSGKSFPNGVTLVGVIEIQTNADGSYIVQPVDFKLNGELLEEGYIRFGSPANQEV